MSGGGHGTPMVCVFDGRTGQERLFGVFRLCAGIGAPDAMVWGIGLDTGPE